MLIFPPAIFVAYRHAVQQQLVAVNPFLLLEFLHWQMSECGGWKFHENLVKNFIGT